MVNGLDPVDMDRAALELLVQALLPHRVGAIAEGPVVVTLRSDVTGEAAAELFVSAQPPQHLSEVELGPPTQLFAGLCIHVNPVDAREHLPTELPVGVFEVRKELGDDFSSVRANVPQMRVRERRGCADDVTTEANLGRSLQRREMRCDRVLEIDPTVEVLVRLHIVVCVCRTGCLAVILLGEETGGAKHDAGEPVIAVDDLAEVLRSQLGRSVDILRSRRNVLRDPSSWRSRIQHERAAEGTRRAGVDKAPHLSRDGFL